jgi:PEP-CTERM motif
MSLLGVLPTGAYPDAMAFSPYDRFAYALHTIYPTAIDIYDLSTFADIGQFSVADQAKIMTTDQTGQPPFFAFDGVYYGHTEVRVYDTGLSVPEPSALALLALGLSAPALRRHPQAARRSSANSRTRPSI